MVHQYQLNGYNIVLDTCSGSIHVVDEVAYDIIALFETHTPDEIVRAMMEKYGSAVTEQELRDCIADVQSLKDGGNSLPRTPSPIWPGPLRSAPETW